MKRMSLVVLALVLLLSACRGAGGQAASEASKGKKETSVESPFHGCPEVPEYPLTDQPTELRLLFPIQGEAIPAGTEKLFSAFEETTGITLDLYPVPANDYLMDINTMIASGEVPDLILSAPDYMLDPDMSDVLLPLDDLVCEYAPNYIRAANQCYDGVLSLVEESGQIMRLYRFFEEPITVPSLGAVIRADWLEELEMEPPETYEDYHQLLSAMKSEYDPELPFRMFSQGLAGGDNFTAGFGISLGSETAYNGFYQQDGVVKYGMLEAGLTEYVTMMRQWFEEGLITLSYTDLADVRSNSYLIELSTGESGVFFVPTSSYKILEELCDFPLVPAMDPVQNPGDVSHLTSSRPTAIYGGGLSISTFCETPELAVQAADWFYSEEAARIGGYGIEGESYRMENGVPEYTELSLLQLGQYTSDIQGIIPNDWVQMKLGDYTEIFSVWNQQKDSRDMLPELFLNEDQRERYGAIMVDVGTYADGCVAQLVSGDMPISQIPDVQARLKEMGLEEIMAMLQEALDAR